MLPGKLLKGNGLRGVYRRTGRNLSFFRGGAGRERGSGQVRSEDGGRGRGTGGARGSLAKLRPAAGVARGKTKSRNLTMSVTVVL